MSINDTLEKLYAESEEIKRKIEIEKAERIRLGARGSVQDVITSQEREKRLKDKLNEINEEITHLESKKNNGLIYLGNDRQRDFLNGIDDDKIIQGAIDDLGLNPGGNHMVEVTNTTTVKVTETYGAGHQNVQQFTHKTTEELEFQGGNKISHNKQAQIEFILRELKNGVEISEAVKRINVSMDDVNHWLVDGKNGKGADNIGFYNEVKQLETSKSQNEITINAKKVEDTKKLESPRNKNKSNINSRSHENSEKKKMDIVLNCLRNGKTYDEAAKQANMHSNEITRWRKKGLKNESDNTIYFYEEIRKIELENIGENDNHIITGKSKSKKRSSKFGYANNVTSRKHGDNIVHPSDISGIKRKTIQNSKFIHPLNVLADIKKEKGPEKIKKEPKPGSNSKNSRKDMQDIILLMKEGYSRKQAAEKLGIDFGRVVEWYRSGFKNRDRYTRNFFKQVKEIEKN